MDLLTGTKSVRQRMPVEARERERLLVYNALMAGPDGLAGFEDWHRRFSGGSASTGVREFYGSQYDLLTAGRNDARSGAAARR